MLLIPIIIIIINVIIFAFPCEMIIFPIPFTPGLAIWLWKWLVPMTSTTSEQKILVWFLQCCFVAFFFLSAIRSLKSLLFRWRARVSEPLLPCSHTNRYRVREINLCSCRHWDLGVVCYDNISEWNLTIVLSLLN